MDYYHSTRITSWEINKLLTSPKQANPQSLRFMSVGNQEEIEESNSDRNRTSNIDETIISPTAVSDSDERNANTKYDNINTGMNDNIEEEEVEPLWQRRRKERLNRNSETNRKYEDIAQSQKTYASNTSQKGRKQEHKKWQKVAPSRFSLEDLDLESTSNIAMKLGSTAANAAIYAASDFSQRMRRLANTVYDLNGIDENGVREAKWKYVSNDQINKDYDDDKRTKRMRRRSSSRTIRRGTSRRDVSINQTGKSPVGEARVVIPEILNALPPKLHDVDYIPDFDKKDIPTDLFAASTSNNNTTKPTLPKMGKQRRKKNRYANDVKKKVYSVYPVDNDEKRSDMEDLYGEAVVHAIDTVGEFVADITEGKYWTNRTGASNRTSSRIETGSPSSQPQKRRYWKDRLTEKVDYALGVHEDGKYYKSWQDQLEREKTRVGGSDAISIFYGRQRKHKGPKKPVAFWEEDGSLMSLFFGRTPEGRTLTLSKLFERENSVNICTTLFKSTFRTALAVLSYLCRWASCRGALPQPIVVFFLAAAAVSSPKRRRLMTVGITLVALRTLAEAIHGYVYGNENWEDDESYSDDKTGSKDTVEEWEGDGL